jgi:hypothetical protein
MLVVKLELWPHGHEDSRQPLGEIRIINDDTGTAQVGNYNVELAHSGRYYGRPGVWKRGRVEGFDRQGPSPYHLVLQALLAALGGTYTSRARTTERPTAAAAGARPSTDTKPCKGCGAQIRWARTDRNRPMPVEPEPSLVVPEPEGALNVLLLDGRVTKARLASEGEQDAVQGYESHFARCPQASNFRRGSEAPRG